MRGRTLLVAVAALVLAACSGSGGSSPTTSADTATPPVSTAAVAATTPPPSATTTPSATTPSGPVATDGSAAATPGRPDGPALPGLLDATADEIPNDDAVRAGELDNGLRYYVRNNDNPGAKADLRLAVHAGSVDELGPSTGVAHFVEHMLFNGTERFPANELIDVLRRFGASFGPDVNAYTTYDETVYSLVVPNDDQTLELGLEVLSEWLQAATFDPDQVVAERGVVLDEWRIRTQTVSGRQVQILSGLYLAGTPYADRAPIGTSTSISAMEADELRAFYDAWYRPDDAAVIVVGDVDVDGVVSDLERLFADATPRTASAPPRPDTTTGLGVFDAPGVRLQPDPDQLTVDIEVTLPIPTGDLTGTARMRADLLDTVAFDVIDERLQRDLADGVAPFDVVQITTNDFVTGLDAPAIYATTDAARARATLTAVLDEYQRVIRHGFTDAEVATSVAKLRASYQTRYDGRESRQDRDIADALVDHFLERTPYPSGEVEYELAMSELDAITPAAVGERFGARWANTWPQVLIAAPESVVDQVPAVDEVEAIVLDTYDREVPARDAGRELPDALMERPESVAPASATSMTSRGFSSFDPVVVTYPNGVRVVLNPNEIVAGEVYLSAASPGGTSLLTDADAIDALYATDVVTAGGLAEFNRADVATITSGADVRVDPYLSPYREWFTGSAATSDLETLFQLLHLYMTEPRFDQVAFDQVLATARPVVLDPSTDPSLTAYDALVDLRYDDEPRYTVVPTPEQFDTVDLAGVERVWNQRYGDAGDWVFAFSGDLDIDTMIDLAGAYLGTLPSTGTVEQPIDVAVAPPASVERADLVAGSGETGSVSMLFTSAVDALPPQLRAASDVVTALLTARFTEVIREELGESYSPYAVSFHDLDPGPMIDTYVQVSGAPERLPQITDLVLGELADLRDDGPDPSEFDAAFAEVHEQYQFVNNIDFLEVMVDDLLEPSMPVDDYLDQYFALDTVDASTVTTYLRDHVPPGAYVEVTVTPR